MDHLAEPEDPAGLTVVLVDDDERMTSLLTSILVDDGFIPRAYCDPAPALAELDEVDPDVVVLDVVMPSRDGLDVAIEIRARRPHQAVVLFSSLFDLRLAAEATRSGFRYVEKADGIDALERAIVDAAADAGAHRTRSGIRR